MNFRCGEGAGDDVCIDQSNKVDGIVLTWFESTFKCAHMNLTHI